MNLPVSTCLPINKLASVFGSTSATYKFYWLISLIELVEEGNIEIPKRKIFSRMISNSWYTINYFHISFGKQDLIQDTIHLLKEDEKITIDEKLNKIRTILISSQKQSTINSLYHFDKQVPHWFLSPWYPKNIGETDSKREKRIYAESKSFIKNPLYALYDDEIIINPTWINYLKENARVLKDFCYWNLVMFLQMKNPNVPDIANKLIKPAVRNSLKKQRTDFWDLVIGELGSITCIYTEKKLTVGHYAVDHFVPYNFVSHDLIWNLIPAEQSFNSHKGDKLPPIEEFFNSFYNLHKKGIDIVRKINPKNKFLEEYLAIFPDLDKSFTNANFKDRIQPLITIASNNGFEFL